MSAPDNSLLYDETLHFGIVRYLAWGFMGIAAMFAGLIIFHVLDGAAGGHPELWYYTLMMCIMTGTALLMWNMRRLCITVGTAGMQVSFGLFTRRFDWNEIQGCYADEVSALRYGGWGIRFARVRGSWRLVYNTIGTPRVVIVRSRGWFREFAFSTVAPDRIIALIRSNRAG